MIAFDFRCPSGHVHENSFPLTAVDRESACPTCGEATLRLFGSPVIRLRGGKSGWSVTHKEAFDAEMSTPAAQRGEIQPISKKASF